MGAPTWPPTPEEARRATLAEYGDDARAVLDLDEAERAILGPFLFASPPPQLAGGEAAGTPLARHQRALEAWLRALTGRDLAVGTSDPPSTDGQAVYLPLAAPPPEQPAEDALFFRVAALVQAGFLHFGLLDQRPVLAEIHRDWVLRSCFHLLALHHLSRRWVAEWPGLRQDFDAVAFLDKAAALRVNLVEVPRLGMPEAFRPLYDGLVAFVEPAGAAGDTAREAVAATRAIADPRAAIPVLLGQATKLRQHFRARRLGPPPLPRYAGLLRPEWLLHDLAAERRAQDAWKEGPGPLRILRDAVRAQGGPGVAGRVRRLLRDTPDRPPPPEALEDTQDPARPEEDGSRRYPEWDAERGVLRVAATRVVEVESAAGALDAFTRTAEANQREIALIRRRFASLRLEERWLHGQPDGSDLDLARVLVAMADLRAGRTPRTDWYLRFQRERQAVAILTLVDVSGSTEGNTIRMEREALVLLAEGMRALGHPHAFYAFANDGPDDCRMQRIRGWDEPYDDRVQRRLVGLRPGGSTRLGAFVRHAAWMLGRRPEGRRVLLLLSDGRPHDRQGYTGAQGVADTAVAVLEARRLGIAVHAVSLDTHETAREYLETIFGAGRFLVMERVDLLPLRLPEVLFGLVR